MTKKLDSSIKFLNLVADYNREPMLLLSAEGEIKEANRTADRLFELAESKITHFDQLKIFLFDNQSFTWEYLEKNISSLPIMVSYTNDKSDTKLVFQFSLKVHKSDLETTYFLVLDPVQDDSVDLETYRQAEEMFYKSFHLSPDAISITRLSDGLFLEVNKSFIQLTGYQREELIGRTVTDVNLWCVPEERKKMTDGLLKGEKSYMEATYRIKGGELAEGQISARAITIDGETCLISVVRDLRHQKKIERELRANKKQLEIINRATNDAIWDWNLQTDELLWNDGMQRIFGYESSDIESVIGWWENKIHEEDRQRVVKRILHFVKKGEETWFDKYRFARKDESYAYVYDKGNILFDENGKPVRMIGGMVDITDRVLAEESLLIRNQQIAEYAFFNSHKVRAPLSRLLGLVLLLDDNHISVEEQKDLLDKVKITAEEIDDMIREITKIFY
ncbi:MAG: PAS domain S-box protein [Bacteroidota bacterium]